MARRSMPISHAVTSPREFVPSKYFTRLVPIPGTVGGLRAVPCRARFCSTCGDEYVPQSWPIPHATCPSNCEDTYHEALAAQGISHDESNPD